MSSFAVMLVPFHICDAKGKDIVGRHNKEYINTRTIMRVVKASENVTYLDLGATGIWVRGDFQEIANTLNMQIWPGPDFT